MVGAVFMLTLVLALGGLSSGPAYSQMPKIEPSPELERLHFQLGTWRVTTQKLDRSGKVVETRHDRSEIALEHGGLMIHILAYPEGAADPTWRIWQFYGRYDGKLHDVSFDAVGHFEHREEVSNNGALAFAFPEPRAFQDGVPRNWRKTYSKIEDDSYKVSWDYTEDEKTWTPMFEATYERLAPAHAGKPEDEPSEAAGPVNPAFAALEWLVGDWQAQFRPHGEDQPAPTMAFAWGDDHRSFLRMSGTQPSPDGRLVPEYESMAIWHPVRQKFVFLSAYLSGAGRVVEDGDIDLLKNGSVQLNMRVHYPAGMALPFSAGAKAGPDGHTLEFRRTFHREGEDGLRGVFRIKRGDTWENPHPELKMDDGYPWRRVRGAS